MLLGGREVIEILIKQHLRTYAASMPSHRAQLKLCAAVDLVKRCVPEGNLLLQEVLQVPLASKGSSADLTLIIVIRAHLAAFFPG